MNADSAGIDLGLRYQLATGKPLLTLETPPHNT
jgi:hypothetical protein